MRPLGTIVLSGLLGVVAFGRGVGSPPGPIVQPVGEPQELERFTFRVTSPAITIQETPEGSLIRIEGFDRKERRTGAPDLPVKTVLVAIPQGARPRLEVRPGVESFQGPLRPRPVPRERVESMAESLESGPWAVEGAAAGPVRIERFEPDPALYDGPGIHPASLAWLGETGVLHDQRYVEVHLAPARYDGARRGLLVTPSFEVAVVFEGGTASAPGPAPTSEFESVYRRAFVNYEQGRSWRLSAGAAPEPASGPGIDDASARRKIKVRANGAVRLDHARMTGTGFTPEPLSTWKLTSNGVEVPLHVVDDDRDGLPEATDGNGLLDPGEFVQFYGQALDFDPKAILNTDLQGDIDLWEAGDFTDENVYFLTIEGGPRSRVATRASAPTHTRTPPADFEAVAHAETDDAWRPLGGADPWYWGPTLMLSGTSSRIDNLTLTGLASGTAPARVLVKVQGRSESASVNPDHATRVTLMNGSNQVLDTDDGSFDGRSLFTHDFTWPGGNPGLSTTAKVKLELLTTPAPANDVILDWVEIRYRRLFQASGDALTFDWPDEDAEFVVTGLASAAPAVYEITSKIGGTGIVDPVLLTGVEVTGAGPHTVRFRMDNDAGLADGTPRRLVVVGDAAATVPATGDFPADVVSDLRNTSNQADLVVIAHPGLLDSPGTCSSTALGQLLSHRLAQDGLTSKVACIEDVQDEFGGGLPGPEAIRSFLAWVMSGSGWAQPKPAFLLLLGDASYDYKAGTANGTWVPTQIMFKDDPAIGYYASDNLLAAVVGPDSLADLAVGRLPARSLAEADLLLQKVLSYEQSPPSGAWRGGALLVTDRGKGYDNFEATEFERISDIGAGKAVSPPHTVLELHYWSDPQYCNKTPAQCNPAVIKADIKDAVNGVGGFDGAALMQFDGHGNFDLWSDDVIFCGTDSGFFCPLDDTLSLTNGNRLPWLLVNNCLSGGFHGTAAKSFGEGWIKRSGGGAIAVLAPSGLGFRFIGEVVTESVWEDVLGPAKERTIGVPVLNSQVLLCGQGSTESCQYYVLLGDPATRLQIPAPAPPSGLSAAAGNAVVNLSWTASPEVAGHRVYRAATTTSSTYQPVGSIVNCPLGGPCAVADTTAVNGTVYFYYVVGVDAGQFESAQSNFNSDCGVSGPDCVTAQPLNPNPPSVPTGLVVTDPETSGRLNLAWNTNPEGDLAFYTVHYGTSPGVYTASVNPGKATQFTLGGLQNGVTYYIALRATNTSQLVSGFSPEQSGVPTFVTGLRAPAFIDDLLLSKSGSDAALSWGAVTTDIYGKPKIVGSYEVYRGTSASFVPVPGNLIGTTATTGFIDPGALSGPTPYHYLVRAVDAEGSGGGLGGQLPAGILDFRVDRAGNCSATTGQTCRLTSECPALESCLFTTPDLLLSWGAVTTDFDGDPAAIDHYEVYASETPFTRADVRDGLVPVLTSTSASSVRITPPASRQNYSVIAVDARDNKSPF